MLPQTLSNGLVSLLNKHSICSLHQQLLSWLYTCLKKADKDKDDKLSQSEMKNFMRMINIEMDDVYTEMLFQVTPMGMPPRLPASPD